MARTRNSDNNAPATAVVNSSVAQGRAKKEQVPQPRRTTVQSHDASENRGSFQCCQGSYGYVHNIHGKSGVERRSDSTTHRYAQYMVPNDKAKICRFTIGLGDHIQDTTATATVSMEAFASVVGFAKEEKKQKRRVEKDQNNKARTTDGFSGSVGGGNKGVPSKGSSPAQSTPQTGGSFSGIHSQGQCRSGMRGCYHCGDIGHLKYNCPKLPLNASTGSTYPSGPSAATVATPTQLAVVRLSPGVGQAEVQGL
ncbi:hypothetical protein HAX54_042061 [Datura stramonium]|uniref:CCHC-type domain-containing protein n=1 Tax=Datura stramonium TaxID=4076 RepID=A0ABS8VYF0_DATST|nr:hypothetical protein [Datura stramonium]